MRRLSAQVKSLLLKVQPLPGLCLENAGIGNAEGPQPAHQELYCHELVIRVEIDLCIWFV